MRINKGMATVVAAGAWVVLGCAVVWASSEGHGAAAEGAHGISQAKLMDLVYRAMNFVVLVGVLFFVLKKPVAAFFRGRTDSIRDELADLEAKREAARKEYALMEKRLKDAEGEREKILAEFRAQGEREKEKILASAQHLAERIKTQAQATIAQETAKAKAELRTEVAEMSAQVAEDLLKQKITSQDQNRLVSEYMSKVRQVLQ